MTVYKANKTMKLLGHQYAFRYMTDENMAALKEILEARGAGRFKNELFDIVLDVFLFGVIIGKRADRERRAKKKAAIHTPQ